MINKVSVIICTYNPAEHIFNKCLDAVSMAAGVERPAEIIIVDNNSDNQFSQEEYFISFTSKNALKLVCEKQQGLTYARLRGIREATGDILVFIDDDNIINTDFFSEVLNISGSYPFIGAFSGQVFLQYENEPPEWTKRYWGMLVYREFSDDRWSNIPFNQESMPCGAGLCIRREVAQHYLRLHLEGKRNFYLDRSKGDLLSGGDNDLAMCACDIGMGMGLFSAIKMHHWIPGERFSLIYLTKLAYGIYFSEKLLKYMRTGRIERLTALGKMKSFVRICLMKPNPAAINRACLKGAAAGVKTLEKINAGKKKL